MDTITIILMIALGIAICVAINRHKAAQRWKKELGEIRNLSSKQSNGLRLKGIEIDKLIKDVEKYKRKEETRDA